MKYSKNADIILLLPLLLFFTTGQREKKILQKNINCECRRSKKVKSIGVWE